LSKTAFPTYSAIALVFAVIDLVAAICAPRSIVESLAFVRTSA
jgi:hypothetical protein